MKMKNWRKIVKIGAETTIAAACRLQRALLEY